jgi:hypothetical protein
LDRVTYTSKGGPLESKSEIFDVMKITFCAIELLSKNKSLFSIDISSNLNSKFEKLKSHVTQSSFFL